MRKTTLFRKMIEAEEILVQPGVGDGFSAGLSETTLGWADVGILRYEANVPRSRDIAARVDIPLSADADTGYGNAVNVVFTERGFEAAGVDGIMLEDLASHKRCGHMDGKEVISTEGGVEKIRTAVEARKYPDFIVKSRTDATGAQRNLRDRVATLLPENDVFVDQFAESMLGDPRRIALAEKVHVLHDPAITARRSRLRHAVRVAAYLKGGTPDGVDRLAELVLRPGSLPDVGALTDAVR